MERLLFLRPNYVYTKVASLVRAIISAAAVCTMLALSLPSARAVTYVSDLQPGSIVNGFGPIGVNQSNGEQSANDGRTLTIQGVTYSKGLGVHAYSELHYDLTGKGCTAFSADAGVDDEVGNLGSIVFQVLSGGTKLYDSGVVTGSMRAKKVSVNLTGRNDLVLVVNDGGDGIDSDHADWGGAALTCSSSTSIYVSDLTPTSVTNGWGPVEKDNSNGEQAANDGHTITIQGVTYAKGLGVHAYSEVHYDLSGKSCTAFNSDIGVDDEVGNLGSVVFQVLSGGTKLYDSGVMTGSMSAKKASVNITGKTDLVLVVNDGGDGVDSDHGDWAGAVLTCGNGGSLNKAPVVNAGPDQTLAFPTAAPLSGTATNDGLPTKKLTMTWSKQSGPGTVTFAASNALSTTATFSTAGTYVLQLSASDGLLTSTDTVTITETVAAPNAPSGLNGTASSSTQISLGWTDNASTEDYALLERCQGSGCTNFAQIAQLAAHTVKYTDSGRAANTTYAYRVRVIAGGTYSGYSNTAQVATPAQNGVVINPDDDMASIVSANPAGTTFLIKAGVHRLQMVSPKDGDVFNGEPGAIMNGARILTLTKEGSYWVAYNQTQQNGPLVGECYSNYPGCVYPEDLYMDGAPLQHMTSLSAVTKGKWYLDYNADKIYMYDDPTGHTMEASVLPYAFNSSGNNVVINGLIVEKYASPAQHGAINWDGNTAQSWTVQNCEIRWNHGTGMRIGPNFKVYNNKFHDMGQLGVGGTGDNVIFQGNELYHNFDWAGYMYEWEAGAHKFVMTNHLQMLSNYSHDNGGNGLWTDIDNINVLYDGNILENNQGAGIAHEISYAAIIRNNTFKNNGLTGACSWLWGAAIQIQNSQNVEAYNNNITISASGCGHGISLIQQNRGSGAYGPYNAINNYIHNNSTTHLGNVGQSGGVEDYPYPDIFAPSSNNRFDYNAYHVPDVTQVHWDWANLMLNWSGFQSYGLEVHGTLDTNIQQ